MILAVFFCKGGLQWLYNLGCKQCMKNITSIYKKTMLEWKPKNYELILQNRFVVMVHPRKFFNAGLWWLSIRCKHVVFVRWETAGAENALIYIQDVPNEIKWDQNIVSYIPLIHRLVVVVVWVLSIFLAVPIILTKVLGIAIDNDKKHINT